MATSRMESMTSRATNGLLPSTGSLFTRGRFVLVCVCVWVCVCVCVSIVCVRVFFGVILAVFLNVPRWRHRFYPSAKDPGTRATLMTMRRRRSVCLLAKNVARSLLSFRKRARMAGGLKREH